jgi:hypothetical protein
VNRGRSNESIPVALFSDHCVNLDVEPVAQSALTLGPSHFLLNPVLPFSLTSQNRLEKSHSLILSVMFTMLKQLLHFDAESTALILGERLEL